jgi:hypothetical protein
MESRLEVDVIEEFEFADNDRTFTCRVEALGPARSEAWWWFRVSGEKADHHRYAPFRAVASDTRASVQAAIVAFYDGLLARRALTAPSYWRRGARGTATAAK